MPPVSSTWQDNMACLAARATDSKRCFDKLETMLAEGRTNANQLRRAEEDAIRTYGLLISALIESFAHG